MKRFKSLVLAAFAVVIAGAYALPAQPVQAAGSASLSIVPKKNYTIEPGKTVNDTLTIRNLDRSEPLSLSLRVVDFTFTDDGGTPKLMLAEDAPQTTWSLKPFVSIPKTVTVEPRSSKTIDMSVDIPANQGAGSFYSAIVYSTGASDGGNVGLSASGVTLVFASVPGKVNENLKLEKFGAYNVAQNDRKAGYVYFATEKPETIGYTLANTGNVTESPVGSITLKPLFGEEITINDINPNSSLALIGQTRTFTSCIKLESEKVDFNGSASQTKACTTPDLLPGYYSVSLNAFYGQNGNRTQDLVGSASFWYMPWWAILILVVAILAVAYYVWKIVRFVKTRKYGGNQFKKRSRRK